MIITSVAQKRQTPYHVSGPGWSSTRLLVKAHGLGYSLNDTWVEPNTEMRLHYTEHIETNYCVAGSGEVVDLASGQTHRLTPGCVYALDQHDEHIVRAGPEGLHLVCVFTPALVGHETHRPDGSYAADTAEPR